MELREVSQPMIEATTYGLSENSRRNNRKIWMFIEHPYFLLSKYKVYRGYQAGETCEVVPL